MISKFDKVTLQAIRRDLNEVLAKYGKSEGLEISIGNIKFSDAEFDAKLNCKIVGAVTMTDRILESIVKSQGLKIEGLGGRRLIEYKSRNYAYPFIYEQNGKRFKCSSEQAKMYFKV